MSFAKVTLLGNLGKDPEMRYTPQGTPICSFSLATSEKRKENGQYKDQTTWWRVTFWGRNAELASQYLTRGNPVCIEGRPFLSEWTGRGGEKRTTLEVTGTDLHFVSAPQGAPNQGGQPPFVNQPGPRPPQAPAVQPQPGTPPPPLSLTDDDTPF